MNTDTLILNIIHQLNEIQKIKLLDFMQAMLHTTKPTKNLLQFAGSIEADELKLMSNAIVADCNNIDENEW
ncbi:MAG: hypothetical protein MUE85_05240 [Microscillaceae bacterium]|jgi:hypothetical protein|nr:hypothetical protein [Microscillaceae bacterium]